VVPRDSAVRLRREAERERYGAAEWHLLEQADGPNADAEGRFIAVFSTGCSDLGPALRAIRELDPEAEEPVGVMLTTLFSATATRVVDSLSFVECIARLGVAEPAVDVPERDYAELSAGASARSGEFFYQREHPITGRGTRVGLSGSGLKGSFIYDDHSAFEGVSIVYADDDARRPAARVAVHRVDRPVDRRERGHQVGPTGGHPPARGIHLPRSLPRGLV
jgi:hypothetical protein